MWPPSRTACTTRKRGTASALLSGRNNSLLKQFYYLCYSTQSSCRPATDLQIITAAESPHPRAVKATPKTHAVIETPFLIVGAGPVGTTLSLLLGQLVVPHILVDRAPSLEAIRSRLPQAHLLSNRSMEIFRSLGHLDARVVQAAPPLKHWRNTSYTTSVNIQDRWSNLLFIHDHFESLRTTEQTYVDPHSPSAICNFPQNKLVALLLDHAVRYFKLVDISDAVNVQPRQADGEVSSSHTIDDDDEETVQRFTSPHGNLLLGYEWAGGFTGRLEVESILRSNTGDESIICRSGFVIGTDGVRSSVRECCLETEGVRMESFGKHEDMVNVGFGSQELGSILKAQNPGLLHFVMNGETCAVLVAYDLEEGSFSAHFPYFQEHQSFERMFNEKRIRQKINAIAGRKLNDVKLMGVRRWKSSSLLASRFRDATTGRVLIAGDAAHAMSPAGGLGMNCGIADVHNLAWKLAHLYHFGRHKYSDPDTLTGSVVDMKGSRLLESYAAERYYAAHYAMKTAQDNHRITTILPSMLGCNPSIGRFVSDKIVAAQEYITKRTKLKFRPIRIVADYVFDVLFRIALKMITIQKKIYPLWLYRQRLCESLRYKRRSLSPFVSWGADLAYAYGNSPLNPDIQNAIPYLRAPMDPTVYSPPTLRGCRIPHTYVLIRQKSNNGFQAHILSTIDIPILKYPSCYFCLLVWDITTLLRIVNQLERAFHDNWVSLTALSTSPTAMSTSTTTSERETGLTANLSTADSSAEECEALASFFSKMFIVIWNIPPTNHERLDESDWIKHESSLKHDVDITTVAGHLGVKEAHQHFPSVGTSPWLIPDAERDELGKDWINEECLSDDAVVGQSDGVRIPKQRSQSGFVKTQTLWWNHPLEMRRIWSDATTLENFKQALQVERLNETSILLRPDSHIAAICASAAQSERLDSFVTEMLKLPLT